MEAVANVIKDGGAMTADANKDVELQKEEEEEDNRLLSTYR